MSDQGSGGQYGGDPDQGWSQQPGQPDFDPTRQYPPVQPGEPDPNLPAPRPPPVDISG